MLRLAHRAPFGAYKRIATAPVVLVIFPLLFSERSVHHNRDYAHKA